MDINEPKLLEIFISTIPAITILSVIICMVAICVLCFSLYTHARHTPMPVCVTYKQEGNYMFFRLVDSKDNTWHSISEIVNIVSADPILFITGINHGLASADVLFTTIGNYYVSLQCASDAYQKHYASQLKLLVILAVLMLPILFYWSLQ